MSSMVIQTSTYAHVRLLDLSYPSPYQNLALEEVLARGCEFSPFSATVRLWVNPPTVVVGRFQDVKAEVDLDTCKKNEIHVARRFTGGGAVFHDEGNLNFTIATRRLEGITLQRIHENNCAVILHVLKNLGLEPILLPPNSVQVSGRKIAGAAAALGRGYLLWHASILVSTDTRMLNQVLSPSRIDVHTSLIRSRWHPVTTVEDAIAKRINIREFKNQLQESFEEFTGTSSERGNLSSYENSEMIALHTEKYSTFEWNFHGCCK